MAYYVCGGAKLKCSMGSQQSDLNVMHPVKPVRIKGKPMAGMSDHKPMLNIKPFGQCQSLANPVVASATAACNGKLQKMPCVPNTTSPWLGCKMNVRVKGNPALLDSSKLMCMWAGVIEIKNPGQDVMKEGGTPVNYKADSVKSEEKAKGLAVEAADPEEIEGQSEEVKELTVKDFVEILEKIESKQGYEAARYYASNRIDYWKITKLAKKYVNETDEEKKEEERDNDPNLMPSRFMILYGADDSKLNKIDNHPDNFDDQPEHKICVEKLREALILMGYDIKESGPFDEPLFQAYLRYLGRFSRINVDNVYEDEADTEKSLENVAEKYGLSSWRYFYKNGDERADHDEIIDELNDDYGDDLIMEKGVEPQSYRPGICYHYPWVPFRLTVNRSNEDSGSKDEEEESKYEIVDSKRDNAIVMEGKVVDGKIEVLVPDVEEPVIFIDGVQIRLNPVRTGGEETAEVVENSQIVEIYWTYGESYTRLNDKEDDGENVVWQSKRYDDLNLHVVTKDGNDGKMVKFVLKTVDKREINLRKIVSENQVVFDKELKNHF